MELTATCQQCNSTLNVDDLQETDWVVCSRCNSMFALASAADEKARTSRMAIVSLVLGLVSLVGLFITGIPAIILGLRSLIRIRREPVRLKGRGLAITGVLTGTMFGCILGGCVSVLAVVSLPSIYAGTQVDTCREQLGNIGLALHLYEHDKGSLPPAASRDKDGRPLLSWRVLILPYFSDRPDLKNLYEQFHLDEPWDSQHNQKLVAAMPDVYRCPADPDTDGTSTHYAAITGPGTGFDDQSGKTRHSDDQDLLSTILIGEVTSGQKIAWTEPRDIPISEFSEGSGWLDGARLGSFDSHHEIAVKQEKDVVFLKVINFNDDRIISVHTESVNKSKTGGHFHFRRRLIVGGHSLKHLTMTEVEVFSGGKNVALQGTATQSSTLDGAEAGRANDGKTDRGNHAYSRTILEPNPWWELKLKEPVPIERFEIHNMSEWDPAVNWILTIQLLDANRKEQWKGTVDGTISFGGSMNIERTRDGILTIGEVSSEDSDSDTAEPPKPTVAQFLRMELSASNVARSPMIPSGHTVPSTSGPITGLPILVEKKGEHFYITKGLDALTTNLRGAELLAIKEYNGKSFQELRGFLLDDARSLLQGPAGSTILLRIRLPETSEVKDVSLKAITYTLPATSPEPTPTPTPDTP